MKILKYADVFLFTFSLLLLAAVFYASVEYEKLEAQNTELRTQLAAAPIPPETRKELEFLRKDNELLNNELSAALKLAVLFKELSDRCEAKLSEKDTR